LRDELAQLTICQPDKRGGQAKPIWTTERT
jgi:hypothetical protein